MVVMNGPAGAGDEPVTGQGSAVLDARDLYRFYRAGTEEVLALRGVSLTVGAGEVVAITGPSGSGKSTLLACLAGLDEPDGGQVWIDGELLSHRPEGERTLMRRRLVGVLRQSGNLIEHLSVRNNVRLVQSLRRRGSRPSSTADELIASVQLDGRGNALPTELSGGELARAALAVALAADPLVLLADEPTGELDVTTERRVLELLHAAARRGAAVVVASHSPAVSRSADRVVRLTDGRQDADLLGARP
ncbi:MAG: transporter related protein [Blastococcus sp.]|jgi:putative ABC transport system ATP-binding protein|nr:transporter related protein [Blastococcus sp.]